MSENFSPVLTENAGVIARADTGHAHGPGTLPVIQLLLEAAAQNAEIAAQFARLSDRRQAREHLRAALEQLNEAELES